MKLISKNSFRQKYQNQLETLFVFILAASVRLTSLNVFRAVDEEDRWAWAVDFYRALLAGDLPATLVGDGYPGIFPVWLETIWLFIASLYRSVLQGGWLDNDGLYLLIHQWSRNDHLWAQRFPVVLTNTILVVIIFLYLRKLFGRRVALLSAILISLDPFYLSDSRVNRAEGLLTGLMTVSLLALIASHRRSTNTTQVNWRHLLISAIFGGLAWLTKSQALVLAPMFTVISLIWYLRAETNWSLALRRWLVTMIAWGLGAAITFILLWPATWTVPGPTFTLMFNYITRKVGQEGVKLFFLGQTILDEDPGLLFYPVIFILRTTPLMLLGLLLAIWLFIRHKFPVNYQLPIPWIGPITNYQSQKNRTPLKTHLTYWLDDAGIWVLAAYALLYIGGMSLGSHKQDRFLMAAFPAMNVLAAIAFVSLTRWRDWSTKRVWIGGGMLLAMQLATALPFHPYYFSYFNPLIGGGPIAAGLTRIGWGEGMDQVGDYLQSQDNADSLVVASRFSNYLLGFKGQSLHLGDDFEWLRADKIIFYIQQSQRMLDPSPGIIRYFQQHVPPEKVITINRIDYARIYPNPIQYPADTMADELKDELALLGYRWKKETETTAAVQLIWENLHGEANPVGVRLWVAQDTHSDWLPCVTMPGFETESKTYGAIVESECRLSAISLPPGLYDLQIGVQQPGSEWLPLAFAAGWSAVELTADGALNRATPETAFSRMADEAVPASATRLEHTYFDHIRLLAYKLAPEHLQPGHPIEITLYWQAHRVLEQDADVSLQLFVGNDQRVALANGPPIGGHSTRPTSSWRPGEVIRDVWYLDIPPETPAPALLRLDVGLFLPETLKPLPVQNLAGEDIPAAIAKIQLEPKTWPAYRGDNAVNFTFGSAIKLIGYKTNTAEDNVLDVTLYWKSLAPVDESYTTFLHLLNADGALVAQSDVAPAQGLFPTSAWQPGDVVLSQHRLALPANSSPGVYTMMAGMYNPADGVRLPVLNAQNQTLINDAAPIGQITVNIGD